MGVRLIKNIDTSLLRAKLEFRHFWPGFSAKDNAFQRLRGYLPSDNTIEITSVFKPLYMRLFEYGISRITRRRFLFTSRSRADRRVWFTAENLRPPVDGGYDATISFDQDDYGGTNTYFPLFYLELLVPNEEWTGRRGKAIEAPRQFLETRRAQGRKSLDVCAFLSNPEPTRLRAIAELRKHMKVDVFGKYVGKPVGSKYEVARHYKYMLCFENDLYPGYVTEKLLDAYSCDTVPLYWGDLGEEPCINRSSFINAKDFATLARFGEHVATLTNAEYDAIYEQPLLNNLPDLQPLLDALEGPRG